MADAQVIVNARHLVKNTGRDFSRVRNALICWYTNADTLTNKMAELRNRLNQAQDKPHMILVIEVKPKNARY